MGKKNDEFNCKFSLTTISKKIGQIVETRSLSSFNGHQIYNLLLFYISLKDENRVLEILKYVEKNWDKNLGVFLFKGEHTSFLLPVYFLKIFSKISENFELDFTKRYLKTFKNCFLEIEKNFDDIYLLISRKDSFSNKFFYSLENSIFLNVADNLFEKLNELSECSIADRIFMMKGKIDLGFRRYFIFNCQEKIIKCFSPNLCEFQLLDDEECLKVVLEGGFFREKFVDKIMQKYRKNISLFSCENFETYLIVLEILFLKKDKLAEKIFRNIQELFNYFPKKIIKTNSKLKNCPSFEKALFFNEVEQVELKSKKIIALGIYDTSCVGFLVEVLDLFIHWKNEL